MKKFIIFLVIISCFACDDGDIIVTSFDFEEQTLQRCDDFDFVFFKINPDNNESLALQFGGDSGFLEEIGTQEITLSGSNSVVYRRFKTAVTADYFCNPIPPVSPTVAEEFTSTSGTIGIMTTGTLTDNDGIDTEEEDDTELRDTDGDGIIDILDFDDDGDNVPTSSEGVVLDENGAIDLVASRDTDLDGIPDFLDPDDDGDGVLTINEDSNMDLDPTNDNSDPDIPTIDDYLNAAVMTNVNTQAYREHVYFLRGILVSIDMTNLDFRNSNGEEVIRDIRTVEFGTYTGAADFEIRVTPDFN